MRLALLGIDDETLALARAAKQSGQHQVVWLCEVSNELIAEFPELIPSNDWQELLEGPFVGAVIVARSDDEDALATRLRLLAQADISLFVSHPASDSPLFYHELDMIRQDTGVRLFPYVRDRWHPFVVELGKQLRSGDAATKVEQITLERALANRSESNVMQQFMRDVCVLRAVCGELDRVSALPGADPTSTFANLAVQMTGKAGIPVRWMVGPVVDRPTGRLSLSTADGPLTIDMKDDAHAWHWTGPETFAPPSQTIDDNSPQVAALDMLTDAVCDKLVDCSWNDACRSVELADAVEQSLRRGRAIQLHDEVYTEAGVFKGLMGMAGCGLLLLGLVIVVLGTTIGALLNRMGFEAGAMVAGWWPYALFTVFAGFLALQLLRLVVPTPEKNRNSEDTST